MTYLDRLCNDLASTRKLVVLQLPNALLPQGPHRRLQPAISRMLLMKGTPRTSKNYNVM